LSKKQPITEPTGRDAVSYLRVSSEGQVNTDYPEGISLPTQREAANQRSHELSAPIAKEFVDPGKTAKTETPSAR
jgi:site-specific DNA recombinase